jgi:hypothetical protein
VLSRIDARRAAAEAIRPDDLVAKAWAWGVRSRVTIARSKDVIERDCDEVSDARIDVHQDRSVRGEEGVKSLQARTQHLDESVSSPLPTIVVGHEIPPRSVRRVEVRERDVAANGRVFEESIEGREVVFMEESHG